MIEYDPSKNENLINFVEVFNKIGGTKLAVVGSRIIVNEPRIKKDLKYILDNSKLKAIVSGGAKGVDTTGEEFAKENNLQPIIHYAEWDKYGKGAGNIRNSYIAEDCDALIAYVQGESRGTMNTLVKIETLKKPFLVIRKKWIVL